AQVDDMDAVVAQFAVAPVPEPVPVVRMIVGAVRPARRRALPELVVEPLGHRRFLASADRLTVALIPPLGEIDATDDAFVKLIHGRDDAVVAAALIAHLHFLLMFA